jgi:hypothetical protein
MMKTLVSLLLVTSWTTGALAQKPSTPESPPEAERIFQEDFESESPEFARHALLDLAPGEGVGGSTGLRATYVGEDRGSSRIVMQQRLPERGTEYTLVYDVRFEDDFQFVRGGKLHGLGPSRPITGGQPMRPDGWSARVTFGPEGSIRTYLYNQDQTGVYGTTRPARDFRFQTGEWHAVSLHVKLNDPDEANGFAHIYVDGERVVAHDNVRFRGEDGDHTLIDRVLFSTFHGGSNPDWAPRTEDGEYATVHATFDNFAVYRGAFVRAQAGE